ncbi:MAG TPA: hypothetical protein DCM05_14180 [Elusimicrobia bacterium]|nr:hypothetical protein [Elusimicrobiota bacterium]
MQTGRAVSYSFLLLAAGAFLLFSPSLSGDFVLDDPAYLAMNPALGSPRAFYDPSVLTADPEQQRMMYRPLTALSFGLGGTNPFWHHLLSSLLHAACGCGVFLLALELLGGLVPAMGAALLFLAHPAQVESVAYLSGSRAGQLSLLFSLLALLLHRRGRAWAAWAAFGAALLSKESAFFLLPVLAAHDLVYGEFRLRRWAPFLAVFAGFWGLRSLVLGQSAQRGLWGGGLAEHLSLSSQGLFHDLRIALWPSGLRSCYSFPQVPGTGLATLAKASLLLGGAALSIALALLRRPAGFALCWFFAGLLPVSNLVPIDALAADRFLYHSLVGLALLWGLALSRMRPLWAALASMVLAVPLAMRSLELQQAWQSPLALDLHAHAAAPEDPCTAVNLASHYFNWGMLDRAESLARRAQRPGVNAHIRASAESLEGFIRMKRDAKAPYRR